MLTRIQNFVLQEYWIIITISIIVSIMKKSASGDTRKGKRDGIETTLFIDTIPSKSNKRKEVDEDCEQNNEHKETSSSCSSSSTLSYSYTAKLPSYLAHAFQEVYQEDGLLVLGRGMGLLHLIASFCRFYVDVDEGHVALLQEELEQEMQIDRCQRSERHQQKCRKISQTNTNSSSIAEEIKSIQNQLRMRKPLVFVIGLRDYERSCIISILEQWGTPTDLLPTEMTNESGQAKERSVLYARGGIFLITSRILIVDLLTHVASPKDIDGILVAHAENISEQSTEAFILRIYRTQKRFGLHVNNRCDTNNPIIQSFRYGFVKAFSDAPDALMSGFGKVDKILKALFVRRLYIYPRFHELVADELERTPPVVEELHQTLSPKMIEIQASIAAAVKVSLSKNFKEIIFIHIF